MDHLKKLAVSSAAWPHLSPPYLSTLFTILFCICCLNSHDNQSTNQLTSQHSLPSPVTCQFQPISSSQLWHVLHTLLLQGSTVSSFDLGPITDLKSNVKSSWHTRSHLSGDVLFKWPAQQFHMFQLINNTQVIYLPLPAGSHNRLCKFISIITYSLSPVASSLQHLNPIH